MQLKTEQEKVLELAAVNANQTLAINEMNRLHEIDAKTIVSMYGDYQKLNRASAQQTAERKTLGQQNAQVKTFLDTPVPADLRRMLNNSNAASRDGYSGNQGIPSASVNSGP